MTPLSNYDETGVPAPGMWQFWLKVLVAVVLAGKVAEWGAGR